MRRAAFCALLFLGGTAAASAQPEATPANPRTIVIGTGTQMKPYCYIDDSGNLAGFEIEVLKAVNRLLPQYKFEIVPQEFVNLLIGLDTGKLDVAAHQFEKNPKREEKYLFADEGYTNFVLRLAVSKERNDIHSLDDMKGKTISVSAGANDTYVINEYNRTHDNAIKVKYSSGIDALARVKDLRDGRVDGFLSIRRMVEGLNKTFGDRIKIVGDPVSTSHAYHLFRKDEVQLKNDFNTALRQLKKDGTLRQLSVDILGGDYIEEE